MNMFNFEAEVNSYTWRFGKTLFNKAMGNEYDWNWVGIFIDSYMVYIAGSTGFWNVFVVIRTFNVIRTP